MLPLPLPPLLLELGAHQLEVAETLVWVGRLLVIVVAARLFAELLVRLQLPTILGELLAGVLLGLSGLHWIVPPETQAQLSDGLLQLLGSESQPELAPDSCTAVGVLPAVLLDLAPPPPALLFATAFVLLHSSCLTMHNQLRLCISEYYLPSPTVLSTPT
jgi:hypothetical protein